VLEQITLTCAAQKARFYSAVNNWLSTLPGETAVERLVHVAKMRWRIERDYQDLKQEFGLGHFEGRGWCGFHHHASLCIAAYG
jgi:SRSO17 transposase